MFIMPSPLEGVGEDIMF